MALEEATWMAFYRESPFGYYRTDVQTGQIAMLLHNVNAPKDKRKKLDHFMPFHRKRVKTDENVSTEILGRFQKIGKHLK